MEKDKFCDRRMVCASCAQTVEKAVAQLPDVSDVAVNLATGEHTQANMDLRSVRKRSCRQSKMRVGAATLSNTLIKLNLKLSKACDQSAFGGIKKRQTIGALIFAGALLLAAMGTTDGSSISALL